MTLLFSDIEGSTRLLRQLRERYDEVLARHRRLLRAAFSAHAGYEIDTQGDSFFVVFGSAREALLAALDGQEALSSHDWPEGGEVRVRMGIHTGQTAVQGDRYTGLAIHRAARICAAAHGGQVLVSQATQTLLEDEEEDLDLALTDLGEHRLKDFDRPVRLYQARADGLPAAFPPPRTSVAIDKESSVDDGGRPPRRTAVVLVAAAVALIGVVVGVLLITRANGGSSHTVQPNHVGVIDPETNQVVGQVKAGADPGPTAAGAASIWVGNLESRTVTQISLARRASVSSISLAGRTPTGLAFGAGAVWVAHGRRGQLSRVDPQSKAITKTIAVADPGSNRGTVAVGLGAVWVAYGDSTVAEIDPRTVRVVAATFGGPGPAGIAVGGGSVWVANSGNGTVTRFERKTFEGGGRTIRVGGTPSAIAYGEGAVWVADSANDAVTRINPSTGSTGKIPIGAPPAAIAVGGGLVWVANADGTVSRIDPLSSRVVASVDVGNVPAGIAFAGDSVWVAVRSA